MPNTTQTQFDLIVLGGGPGGYTAAIRASRENLSIALVEETERLGGICLNWGCIPTKSLLRSTEIYENVRSAGDFGVTAIDAGFRWEDIIGRSRTVSDGFSDGVDFLMKKNGITVFHGRGILEGGGKLRISGADETVLTARHIIIATGARPAGIPEVRIDRKTVITASEALVLGKQPDSMVIAGAGAVGIEFACFFNSFGTDVTLLEARGRILPGADREISKRLAAFLKRRGINVMTSSTVAKAESDGGMCSVNVKNIQNGEDTGTIECDKLLVAAGSVGNTENIGLENAGVEVESGFISVDEMCRTTAEKILAVGDCIGAPLLAHAASMEAECAVDSIAGIKSGGTGQHCIPYCIYSKPQTAWAGLSEQAASDAGYDIAVGKCPFRSIGQAVALGEPDGFVKAVIDKASGKILGVHIIGAGATEIIQEIVLAIDHGISAERLIKTVHPHPTLSEAVRESVAGALGKSINI
jgi:dihydrolipoamide dehydrogenase